MKKENGWDLHHPQLRKLYTFQKNSRNLLKKFMLLSRMNNLNRHLTMMNILKSRHRLTMTLIILLVIIQVVIILTIQVCIHLHIRIVIDGIYLPAGLTVLERSVQREVFTRGHPVLHQERDQPGNLREREWVVVFVRAEAIL
jgi:hypothetical protein